MIEKHHLIQKSLISKATKISVINNFLAKKLNTKSEFVFYYQSQMVALLTNLKELEDRFKPEDGILRLEC
jgi:hypothetical protein